MDPKRGRTQCTEERTPTGQRNPTTRNPLEGQGLKEQSPGPPRSPLKRRARRRPAPGEGWYYVSNVYEGGRTPLRALYSEVVGEPSTHPRRAPYGDPYRGNREITYLRRARIPYCEWRCCSSGDQTEDDEEEMARQEIPVPGRQPYPTARANIYRGPATDKRQEAAKAAPPRREKRLGRRVTPEAVLVRIQQGDTYLETYRTIAGELNPQNSDTRDKPE